MAIKFSIKLNIVEYIKRKVTKIEEKKLYYWFQWIQALYFLSLVMFSLFPSDSYTIACISLWDFSPVMRHINLLLVISHTCKVNQT